jgi:dTDP-4-amino-4,6-dideoxygalactose transaminase
MVTVPFNRPFAGRLAQEYVGQCLASGHHSGDGPWSNRVTEVLSPMVGGGRVFLTPSGTDALELSLMALGIGPGDEVIVPSFTFSSTATAVQRQGAVVRFADVDPRTLSMGLEEVRELLCSKTKAVIAVHYGGQSGDILQLSEYLASLGVALVEDAAHALGGSFRNIPFGSFGSLSCFSFHETKNLSCGEGGALVVNDERLAHRVEKIREKGTDRSSFFRGQVDKYTWVSPGSSFLLSDISAALLAASLEDWTETQDNRKRAWDAYNSRLTFFAKATRSQLPRNLENCQQPHHIYHVLAQSSEMRDSLLAHCRSRGIMAVSHYQPLADSAEGRRANQPHNDLCPVSTDVSERLLRLPLYSAITSADVESVVKVLNEWSAEIPAINVNDSLSIKGPSGDVAFGL